jgi:ribosomal protein L14E/L6E/L27E
MIKAHYLKTLINSTKNALDDGTCGREILGYIKLEVKKETEEKGIMKATGCDGFSLSIISKPCITDENFTAYIRPISIGRVRDNTTAIVEIVDNRCLISIDDNVVGFRQPSLDGKKIIDTDQYMREVEAAKSEYEIAFDVQKLIRILKCISASVDTNCTSDRAIRLKLTGKVNAMLVEAKVGGKAILLPTRNRYPEG